MSINAEIKQITRVLLGVILKSDNYRDTVFII